MKKYLNKVLIGDCLEELKKLPDNSIDSVVTDPPYGLSKEPDIVEVLLKWLNNEPYDHKHKGFMGKAWDSFVPQPDIWREVFRVLKPGGYCLVFSGTRTQDLMTISLRLAGFEIRDVIEWLYFSGFPKNLDIGKQFDKRGGTIADFEEFRDACIEALKKPGKTRKQLQELLGNYMLSHYLTKGSQPAVPVYRDYVVIRDYLELGDRFDKYFKEPAEREKIGEQYNIANRNNTNTGCYNWNTKNQKRKDYIDITAPATELAKKWDGWGTGLKPAHEPILMFRKPIEKTVAYNVEKWGTGGLNIDGCRIDYGNSKKPKSMTNQNIKGNAYKQDNSSRERDTVYNPSEKGRFPANCVTIEDDQFYSKYFNITPKELSKKASKKDRNSNWKGEQISSKNKHATVKPVPLMEWLIKLITPSNGTVLDPFCGSGSTLVAAKKNGFNFIGVELIREYAEIAEERIKE